MADITHSSEPAPDDHLHALDFLWLEITGKCNLECVHCYADSGPREHLQGRMERRDWLNILDEGRQLGCRQVQFIGGEPTLHPDLEEMIRHARAQGYEYIEVYTNATRLSPHLLSVFEECQVCLAASFYSADPAVHDRVTARPGSHKSTVNGIRRALERGLVVRVGVIETPENPGHTDAAEKFVRALGVSHVSFATQRSVGRGRADRSMPSSNPMNELCDGCSEGKLCVTSDGATYPCVMSRHLDLGDARHGLGRILDDNPLHQFRIAHRTEVASRGERRASVHGPIVDAGHSREAQCPQSSCPQSCGPTAPKPEKCAVPPPTLGDHNRRDKQAPQEGEPKPPAPEEPLCSPSPAAGDASRREAQCPQSSCPQSCGPTAPKPEKCTVPPPVMDERNRRDTECPQSCTPKPPKPDEPQCAVPPPITCVPNRRVTNSGRDGDALHY